MRGRCRQPIILSLIILILSGCSHPISRQNRLGVLQDLTPESLLRDLETYRGKLVLLGGEIIETRNLENETVIEILQRPLRRYNSRPLRGEDHDGRFLVRYETFKDPYIFSQGREMTVVGTVVGKEVSKIDQKSYTYVLLENRESHLWPEEAEYGGEHPYRYPPLWWDPPWWPYRYPPPYPYW
jgi:outer membrane lipoprotein